MWSSSSSTRFCSSRICCRSLDGDVKKQQEAEDTWMEPFRSSKSKRRQREKVGDYNNHDIADDAQLFLYADNDNILVATTTDSATTRPCSDICSLFSSNGRISETNPNLNCSDTSQDDSSMNKKWRHPFGDTLGKGFTKGMKNALVSPSPGGFLDGKSEKYAKRQNETINSPAPREEQPSKPITTIAVLENGFFLTASKSDKYIQLRKVVLSPQGEENGQMEEHAESIDENDKIEFICKFKGHSSGVTQIVKLDTRGRFLTSSLDKTVKLWELDCNDEVNWKDDGPNLLATFTDLHERWIKSITILDEGSFVKPTDDLSISMVKAMAEKTVLEGVTSMQQAAFDRSIIKCSGSFATSSINGKIVKVWDMTVLDNKADSFTTSNNNVSKANMVQELKHEMAVEVIDATEDGHNIIVGDVMGDIFLWRKSKSILSRFGFVQGKRWALIHKFTWRHDIKRPHLDEIFQHSVTSLCFLDKSRFVSGTKEGLIQIWDGSSADKLQTIRVAETPVSIVQKLSIDEPDLEGFSVCCADGRVVSLTLTIQEDDVVELDAFPVDCTNRSANSSIVTSIKSIALPCNNNAKPIIRLIVGDSHGNASLTRN